MIKKLKQSANDKSSRTSSNVFEYTSLNILILNGKVRFLCNALIPVTVPHFDE